MVDIAQVFGWIATILFSIMIVPQMIKTMKEKTVDGVSLSLFVVYLVANMFALTYAFLIIQTPLIFKYIVAIGTTLAYLTVFVYYRKNERKKTVARSQ